MLNLTETIKTKKEDFLESALENVMQAIEEPHDIATDRLIDAISQIIIALKMEKE